MEVDIEEDENKPELTYPYEEDSDGLLPGLMRRDINSLFGRGFSSDDLCGSARRAMHRKKKGKAKTSIMMIRRGYVCEERPNEAIDVLVKDEKSPSSEPRGLLGDLVV
ncbi:hypothetical protein Tco_1203229 [Tanacetum coccineum]